jgi:hypothetical protein
MFNRSAAHEIPDSPTLLDALPLAKEKIMAA